MALSTGRQNAILLIILLVGQLLLMSGSVRGKSGSSVLQGWFVRLSSPAVGVSRLFAGGFRGGAASARGLLAARARNVLLEADVRRMEIQMERYREAEGENRRLRRLLDMREELVPRSIPASVVTANLNGNTRMIIVNRGRRDGVLRELPVVAWGGVVGRVEESFARHSKVRLLSDPNSGVAAVVQRSRAQGMVLGRAKPTLDLLYVPRFSDVVHGDRVVTSGLDGIFPPGFGIGRVTSILETPDGILTIQLEPELDYAGLEEVLVVLEPPSGDLLGLPAAEGGS